ncbi:hypothetical protein NMY22_g18262 [Coprinellus aureogranulatus]|nr:hypothetical protein NMY22_g18262 [Coprinellus aureogranulatus]
MAPLHIYNSLAFLVPTFLVLLGGLAEFAFAVPLLAEPPLAERSANSTRLAKRFDGARFSFYDAGLGACGEVNSNSDFIVALNIAQWDNKAHCGETITISFGGKTARAKIMDLCPGCPYGGLDLTRGLFSYFASQDLGIIHGTWNFGSAGGAPAPRPTTTSMRHTTSRTSSLTRPSTTYTHSRTSTTTPPPTPSTSTHATSRTTTLALTTTSTTLSSDGTVPTAIASAGESAQPDAIQQLAFILLRLGAMIAHFAKENEGA